MDLEDKTYNTLDFQQLGWKNKIKKIYMVISSETNFSLPPSWQQLCESKGNFIPFIPILFQ